MAKKEDIITTEPVAAAPTVLLATAHTGYNYQLLSTGVVQKKDATQVIGEWQTPQQFLQYVADLCMLPGQKLTAAELQIINFIKEDNL